MNLTDKVSQHKSKRIIRRHLSNNNLIPHQDTVNFTGEITTNDSYFLESEVSISITPTPTTSDTLTPTPTSTPIPTLSRTIIYPTPSHTPSPYPPCKATDDQYLLYQNNPETLYILENDSENSKITNILVPPIHGRLEFSEKSVTYFPDLHYVGPDEFLYEITDSYGQRCTANVYLYVYYKPQLSVSFQLIELPNGHIMATPYDLYESRHWTYDPMSKHTTFHGVFYEYEQTRTGVLLDNQTVFMPPYRGDHQAKIWDYQDPSNVITLPTIYPDYMTQSAVKLQDGRVFISPYRGDNKARIWDPTNPNTIEVLPSIYPDYATIDCILLQDGRVFMSSWLGDFRSRIWDPANPNTVYVVPILYNNFCSGKAVLLSDGRVFMVPYHGGESNARIWNPTKPAVDHILSDTFPTYYSRSAVLIKNGDIDTVIMAPESGDGYFRYWNSNEPNRVQLIGSSLNIPYTFDCLLHSDGNIYTAPNSYQIEMHHLSSDYQLQQAINWKFSVV